MRGTISTGTLCSSGACQLQDHIRGHVFCLGVLVHCFCVDLHCTASLFWFLGLCIMLSSGKKGLPLVLSKGQISAGISVANIKFHLDLAAVSHIGGCVACTLIMCLTSQLSLSGASEIDSFLCELMPIINHSCDDPTVILLLTSLISFIEALFPFLLSLASSVCIITTILRIPCNAGRQKAFCPCSAYLTRHQQNEKGEENSLYYTTSPLLSFGQDIDSSSYSMAGPRNSLAEKLFTSAEKAAPNRGGCCRG